MAGRTHYDILGIGKDADEESIRKAYHKAALDYHPDRNPGNAEAEAHFREATESYSILSDTEKKKIYDFQLEMISSASRPRPRPMPSSRVRSEVEDVFSDIFNFANHANFDIPFGGAPFVSGTPRGRSVGNEVHGRDIDIQLVLTLEEAVAGCIKDVSPRSSGMVICVACSGTRATPGTRLINCGSCSGTGRRMRYPSGGGGLGGPGVCPACRGTKQMPVSPCITCGGKGRTKGQRTVKVKVPAGIDNGQKLRLAGMGDGGDGESPGDLYVEILISPHRIFKRSGLDLFIDHQLSLPDAVRGGRICVPTLDGRQISVDVPPRIQPGQTVISVRGAGIKSTMRSENGDLNVTLQVKLPDVYTPRAQKLLEELMDEIDRTTPKG